MFIVEGVIVAKRIHRLPSKTRYPANNNLPNICLKEKICTPRERCTSNYISVGWKYRASEVLRV